jgi:hypothetical protein
MRLIAKPAAYIGIMLIGVGAAIGQEVTLPLPDYHALRERANPQPTPTPPPPAPFALEEASIEVAAGAASARVVQNLTLSVYGTDWQSVSVPAAGRLTARDLGGLEGRVKSDDGWVLVVRGSGRHRVRLESVVDVVALEKATRPTSALEVSLPAAAIVTGVLRVGAEVEEVVLERGGVVRNHTGAAWEFVGAPGATLRASVLGKATAPKRSTLPLRFVAAAATRASASRTRLRATAWISARVLQGQLDTLQVKLPATLSVVSVQSTPETGWDVKDGALVLTPLAPVEQALQTTVTLTGEPANEFDSPLAIPIGATRTTLASEVVVEGDGLAELVTTGSGRLPEERERRQLPAGSMADSRFALLIEDAARPPRWLITWPEKTEALAAQVDRLTLDILLGDAGVAGYQCFVEVRNSGATALSITPPPGFKLTEARRDGVVITPGSSDKALVVPLSASDKLQLVQIAGLVPMRLPDRDGELVVPVPALSAPIKLQVKVQKEKWGWF